MTGRRFDESHVLALAALLGPIVALYNALGMAPLFTLVAVACLVLTRSRKPWLRVSKPFAMVLTAAALWTAASLFWTIEPHMGLYTTIRMVGFAGGGLVLVAIAGDLDETGRRRLRLALAGGVTTVFIMAAIEIYWRGPGGMVFYMRNPSFDSYIPRLGRGLTVATILLAPAVIAAWRSDYRGWAAALFALAIPVIFGAHSLSAKLALGLMPAILLLTWWRARGVSRALRTALVALILAFPLMSLIPSPQATFDRLPWLPNSAHHRLTIWNFAATKLLEHPIRGWGIEAARSIPDGETTLRLWRFDDRFRDQGWPDGYVPVDEQLMPLHTHNAPGQVWLELGVVGASLLCLLLVLLGRAAVSRPNRVDAAVMISTLTSAFIIASVGYGIWQSWWLGSLWLAAALCAAIAEPTDTATAQVLPENPT